MHGALCFTSLKTVVQTDTIGHVRGARWGPYELHTVKGELVMRKSVMNKGFFCFAVGLMTTGTWAQGPIIKLWVTEVYEVNPDGSYTPKCGVDEGGERICPTQDLPPGIAQPGDLINIETTVEGWDVDSDSGACSPEGEACSVSVV